MNYYESEANTFFANTVDINVSEVLTPFTDLLPDKARVLDAGCGSGRDTLFFKQQGFIVDAFDASFALSSLAAEYSGVPVTRQRIQNFYYDHLYDGIWCNAVLVHIPPADMEVVVERLRNQLRKPTSGNWAMEALPGGVLFVSFKSGVFEQRKEGKRTFTDMDEGSLQGIFDRLKLRVIRLWTTIDRRPDNNTTWLNAIVQRSAHE